jgi:uncharacterized membrane protein YeaQ/YmgE (transglycosylase-associated protein family)
MFLLSLIWLLIGLLIGGLAWMAQCSPLSWRLGWLRMLALGAIAALCAGWLGVLLLGNFFSTIQVLWLTILCVIALPRVIHWLYMRLHIKIL